MGGGGETPPPNNMKNLSHNDKITLYLTEPGVYSLVMYSKKKEAEDFQDFIFEKVIPSIEAIAYNVEDDDRKN